MILNYNLYLKKKKKVIFNQCLVRLPGKFGLRTHVFVCVLMVGREHMFKNIVRKHLNQEILQLGQIQ